MKTLYLAAACLLVPALASAKDDPPSDANIAAIVVAADQVDVDAGNQALAKSTNPEVKKFAQTMVTDHTAVNRKATDLAGKLKLTPEDNDLSKKLKSDAAATADKMGKLSGAEFDKAYVANEIAYHKAVIDVVSKSLIPSAKNPELKKLLEQGAPIFKQHLAHAEQLEKSLSK
jgi:putative membrane protein